MNIRKITLTTDAAGALDTVANVTGEIISVGLLIGDLSTPDLTLTDKLTAKSIVTKAGIAADVHYHPRVLAQHSDATDVAAAAGPPVLNENYVPVTVFGKLRIQLSGAGDTKTGTLLIAYRG